MALSATDRGTGSNNSASTSMTFTPASNMTAGALGVLCIALDNAGSAGSTAVAPTSFTDAKGNTWTRRQDAIYDPGAASAGVELAIYTATLTSALLTSDTSTINWLSSTSVTAKAWTLREISTNGGAGKFVAYVTGGVGTGAGTGTPTVTTGSITSGDCVVGAGGAESADTWTGDADTSNGSWSTHQHTGVGSGNTGMSVTSQAKVVTATATQTYNPTLTSADCILAWIQTRELNQYTLTAAQGSFTRTGQAVSLKVGRKMSAASGSFTLTGQSVTLTRQGLPLQGIVAAWRLEETSGQRVDSTGRSANNLSDVNTVTSSTGKIGTGAHFTRANSEYLSCATNSDLEMGDIHCAFAIWFKLASKSGDMAIMGKWNNDIVPSTVEYTIWYNSSLDRIRFAVNDYNGLVTAGNIGGGSASPPTGQWLQAIGWHDPDANLVGIQVNTESAEGTPTTSSYSSGIPARSNPFRLGADAFPNFFFDGDMDAPLVWKRQLTSGDRTAVWNGGAGIEFTSPIAKAGQDQVRTESEVVYLDGTRSLGNGITYSWSQLSGTSVTLTGATTAQPHFTAPAETTSEDLVFRVVVTDAASVQSQDDVTIKVVDTSSTEWRWYTPYEAGMNPDLFYPAFDALPSPCLVARNGRIIATKGDVTLPGYVWSASKMLCSLIFARQKQLGNIAYTDTIPASDFPSSPLATARQFLEMTSDYGLSSPSHSPGDHYAYNNGAYHHFGTHLKTTFYSGQTHVQTLQNAYFSALNPQDTLGYNTAGYMSGWDGGWSMSTRDLARIAQLVIQDGVWAGTQILDPTYCNSDLWELSIPGPATQSTDTHDQFYNQDATSAVMKTQWGLGFWYLPAGAFIVQEAAVMFGKFGTSAYMSRALDLIAVSANVGGATDDSNAVYILSSQFEAVANSVFNAYTLAAGSGSFTKSGQSVQLLRGRTTSLASGSYTKTGNSVGLSVGKTLAIETAMFTETGQNVGLQATRKLTANAGSFSELGQATSLKWGHQTTLNSGVLGLTGNATQLLFSHRISLLTGSFNLSGNAVSLLFGHRISLNSGSFTETGISVGLIYTPVLAYTLAAGVGLFTETGNVTNLLRSRLLPVTTGSFSETGFPASLLYGHKGQLNLGTFTETGFSANLLRGLKINLETGVFNESGQSISLLRGRQLGASTGVFNESGSDQSLLWKRLISLATGMFTETGVPVNLRTSSALQLALGVFNLNGQPVVLKADHLLTADSSTFTLTGHDTSFPWQRGIHVDQGMIAITAFDVPLRHDRLIPVITGIFNYTGNPVILTFSGHVSTVQPFAIISVVEKPFAVLSLITQGSATITVTDKPVATITKWP